MAVAVATEEVGEFPAALAEAAILLRCLLEAGKCSLAAAWGHGEANVGVAATGTAAIGVGNVGVAATGTAAVGVGSAGVAATGTGVTGVVAGIITMVITLFSSGISVFRGGGVGAGATPTDTTDIMIIPIRTTTTGPDTGMVTMAMILGRPATITDMATRLGVTAAITTARTMEMTTQIALITAARTMETAIPPIREWPSCKAALREPGITLGLLMESWGLRPGKQFALSSATMPNP